LPDELRAGLALAAGAVGALALTPVAMGVAVRTRFLDWPVGYKGHATATPYLGGAAVLSACLIGVLIAAPSLRHVGPLAVGALVLWAVGTADDRVTVSPLVRVLVEIFLAAWLWLIGLGWNTGAGGLADLLVTALFVVGAVNAFNLMDNMDGTAGAVAVAAGLGVTVLALEHHDAAVAVLAAALAGACLGFLRYNLAAPARIFLGDGGSIPVGFLLAATVMSTLHSARSGGPALVVGLVVVGLPLLDTALVVVSRTRRGVSVLTAGRDHMTHRLRTRLGTPRRVALAVGGGQAVLALAVLVADRLGPAPVYAAGVLYAVLVVMTVAKLETPPWAPRPQSSA